MTSLQHNFLKNFSTDFSEILVGNVELMPDKVLKVLHCYLSSFLSYRENTGGGGGIFAHTHPVGRGLNEQIERYSKLRHRPK